MTDGHTEQTRQSLWFLITALCVGGAEQTLVNLANDVDAEQYDVTIWTIFETNPLESAVDPHVTIRSLTDCGRVENGSVVAVSNPLAYLTVPIRFCWVAATEQPDIVQSFLFFDNLLARLAGLVSPATIITGVRSVPNDPSRIRAALDSVTIGLSDRVVSNSRDGAALAVERGADPACVSVIPNGRRVEQFSRASPEAVETELGLESDELVVGTVGRLLERKGHFELVTAWARVLEREPNARLLLVGDGQDADAIQSQAEQLGCTAQIEFMGTRRDIPSLLAAMDVFVFPSHFEGLPGAVIEAMAAGVPIVATPVDGTADLLDSYHTALFVPVEAPDALAWAITRLLEAPTLRDGLGEAARERARERYTVATMVEQFEALYREVGPCGTAGASQLSADRATSRPGRATPES